MNKKKRELGQNELVESLESNIESIKPHMPKIIMFTVVGVLATLAIAFWFQTRKSVSENQWREYFMSTRFTDSRGMGAVAEFFPGTTVGQLALLSAGDSDFANGSDKVVENRDEYDTKLKLAADKYKQIIESSSKASPFARTRATYALGYTYESLGRFKEARELYQELVDSAGGTPVGELAAKSLKRVDDPSITAIYQAFADWTPSTDAPDTTVPLPKRPDISFPTDDPAAAEEPSGTPTPAGETESPADDAETDAEDESTDDPVKTADETATDDETSDETTSGGETTGSETETEEGGGAEKSEGGNQQ